MLQGKITISGKKKKNTATTKQNQISKPARNVSIIDEEGQSIPGLKSPLAIINSLQNWDDASPAPERCSDEMCDGSLSYPHWESWVWRWEKAEVVENCCQKKKFHCGPRSCLMPMLVKGSYRRICQEREIDNFWLKKYLLKNSKLTDWNTSE